jgi:hypothetical protein
MDVIGFLHVSLSRDTAHLRASLSSRRAYACSEAGFCSQNGDMAWGLYYRRIAFCCPLLLAKRLNSKDVNKQTFPVYGGKCFSRKSIHKWVEKRGKYFANDEDDVPKWLRQRVKRLKCCAFRLTSIAMGQIYQCWWRICPEINVISRFEYHIYYVLYPFVIYLLTLPRNIAWNLQITTFVLNVRD